MVALLTHLINIFSHFIVDGLVALIAIIAVGGASLVLPQIRQSEYRSAFPYLSVAFFILALELSLRVLPNPLLVIQVVTCLFISMSIGGYLLVGKRLVASLLRSTVFLGVIVAVTLLCGFFLYNLTYQNGLHDEYYHHANIKLFFESPTYPFLEPYRIGSTISGYHVGLYFPVIALKALTALSVEQSLDIMKLSLFIPAPLVLSKLLARYFSISDFSSAALTGIGFIVGPSLFLLDSFSDNVLRGLSYPQLHTPILFEYAGLTWHGLTFFLVFTLVIQLILRDQTDFLQKLLRLSRPSVATFRSLLLFAFCSVASLWFINRAFCLAFVIVGIVTVLFYLIRQLSIKYQQILLGLVGVIITLLVIATLFGNYAPLFRSPNTWGVVYLDLLIDESAVSRFRYATMTQLVFWKYLGVLGLLTITLGAVKKRFSDPWLFTILFLFPVWVYFGKTPGADADDLAFTKLLRPLFLILPMCVYAYSKSWKPLPRSIVTALIVLGCLSPAYFFITARFSGIQQDWVVTEPALHDLVDHLPSHSRAVGIQANTQSLQHVIANVVHAQVEICYTACGERTEVTYIIEQKEKPMQVASTRKIVYENASYRLYR